MMSMTSKSAAAVRTPAMSKSSFNGAAVKIAAPVARPVARQTSLVLTAKDKRSSPTLEEVSSQQRHEKDSGSTEVQIALLTGRILKLTDHLKNHHKDHSTNRGLQKCLGQRRSLLEYMYKTDAEKYFALTTELNIRTKKLR
ncbi:hypothetical protein CYMTET_31583 [Cymbomonas tetramitiformis]|uniref:30S ribosomal protein S15 n=1 Tax=Cymbomonas tetramitiformis TaxID=36881 RepID=A0AAE0FGP2_9CHLO|nr:hypothetical protein CYMTET_31583 [Cymbomonas tetramitiformis]|eukprot:gene14121-16699_t